MIANKWMLLALQILNAILVTLAAYHWSDVVSAQTASLIGIGISALLAVIAGLMPPVSQPTVIATGGKFFTHT